MRKNLLMFGVFCLAANMMAQSQKNDTTLRWKFPTIINISLSQTSFSNWSAGGENSYAVNGLFLSDLNYKDTSKLWENNFTLAYGLMKQGDKEVRKTDDKLEFSSKFGYRASKSWYYSILMQFKTQFSNGYQYDDNAGTKTKLSGFMSPGFLSLAIGMNYAPSKAFSLFIGPLSGKSTMVIDEELSNKKAFGVDSGKHVRHEFGGMIKVLYTKEIMKNVTLNSNLNMFSNYAKNPECIDIDFLFLLNMKINKWLSSNISLQMLFDDDTKVINEDGSIHGAKIQFKEVFGIGLSFTL